ARTYTPREALRGALGRWVSESAVCGVRSARAIYCVLTAGRLRHGRVPMGGTGSVSDTRIPRQLLEFRHCSPRGVERIDEASGSVRTPSTTYCSTSLCGPVTSPLGTKEPGPTLRATSVVCRTGSHTPNSQDQRATPCSPPGSPRAGHRVPRPELPLRITPW